MDPLDFDPATTTLARLVTGVPRRPAGDPTPCPDYTVADLLDHIGGLALAFTASARKERRARRWQAPARRLPARGGLAGRIAAQLAELADAWRDPAAYDGMTRRARSRCRPRSAALVALDEVVVHGWDLAAVHRPGLRRRRRGAAAAAWAFVATFEPPGGRRRRPVRPAGPRPRRRRRARPAARRDRPRPALDPLIRFRAAPAASGTFPAVACPSGLRRTPRKRLWVQAHRGFKSLRHRQGPAESSPQTQRRKSQRRRSGIRIRVHRGGVVASPCCSRRTAVVR